MFVALLMFAGIAFAIAHFLGRKRQIGFGWSFFFSIFVSFFGGLIVTMLSPKYYEPNPAPSNAKKIWGWILIVLCGLGAVGSLVRIAAGDTAAFNTLSVGIGLTGLGFYLLELSKGKNFNTEALTKVDS